MKNIYFLGLSSTSLPVQPVTLGQLYTADLAPMSFWRARLPIAQANAAIQLNLTLGE